MIEKTISDVRTDWEKISLINFNSNKSINTKIDTFKNKEGNTLQGSTVKVKRDITGIEAENRVVYNLNCLVVEKVII